MSKLNPYTLQVQEFHRAFGHPIGRRPALLDPKLAELRVRLIAEELCEYAAAVGVALHIDLNPHSTDPTKAEPHVAVQFQAWAARSLYAAADALGDINYVVAGAEVAHALPATDVFAAIHASNMSKLGADGKPIYREDGKIMKGPNYAPPTEAIKRAVDDYDAFCTQISEPVGANYPKHSASDAKAEMVHAAKITNLDGANPLGR